VNNLIHKLLLVGKFILIIHIRFRV
jgi:hypothetical protein